jgi:putative SOS response-associated peptidase YedK
MCQTIWVALSAIGTIAMATTTFITLRNNSKDNKNNHQLQLNVLNYQQQMQWMDRLRDVCIKKHIFI